MRMDRYDEDKEKQDEKQSRLNKNQELYTDVYLNNVYVDINNIKEVMNQEEDTKEEVRTVKEPLEVDYTYEEKNYDINSIIEEALKSKEDDNLKRSIDIDSDNEKLDTLIESLNEKAQEEEKEMEKNELLSDLLPENENTEVIPPLEEPILDTSIYKNESFLVLPDNEETDEYEPLSNEITDEDMEDDTFIEKEGSKHIKLIIIIGVILVIIAVVVILKILKIF